MFSRSSTWLRRSHYVWMTLIFHPIVVPLLLCAINQLEFVGAEVVEESAGLSEPFFKNNDDISTILLALMSSFHAGNRWLAHKIVHNCLCLCRIRVSRKTLIATASNVDSLDLVLAVVVDANKLFIHFRSFHCGKAHRNEWIR
jgi:hypothetical protein